MIVILVTFVMQVYYYNSHTKKYTIELPEAGYGDLPHFDEL